MTPCVGLVSWLAIDSLHRVANSIQAVFHGVDRSLTAVSLLYSGSIHPFIDMVILCGENCAISIQKISTTLVCWPHYPSTSLCLLHVYLSRVWLENGTHTEQLYFISRHSTLGSFTAETTTTTTSGYRNKDTLGTIEL